MLNSVTNFVNKIVTHFANICFETLLKIIYCLLRERTSKVADFNKENN